MKFVKVENCSELNGTNMWLQKDFIKNRNKNSGWIFVEQQETKKSVLNILSKNNQQAEVSQWSLYRQVI